MLRATLRSLLARKLRLVLSALAVVLGVMFVSGSFVLTDTLGRTFDNLFTSALSQTDVLVTAKPPIEMSELEGESVAKPLGADVRDRVAAVDGVARVTGIAEADGARLIGADGKVVTSAGPPRLGSNWAGEIGDLRLSPGSRAPTAPDEIVINRQLAETAKVRVGDRVGVLTLAPKRMFTIVGTFGYTGDRDSIGGVQEVKFIEPVAQELMLGQPGTYTSLDVAAADGVDPAALRDRLAATLGADFQVRTGQEAADEMTAQFQEGLGFFNNILLGFAAVALFVGVFLILNTFSILIAQRTKELGLTRAIGASRRQVIGSVLVEALVIGLIASVLGLAAGVGVGVLLAYLFGIFAGGLQLAGVGVPAAAVIGAFTVGLLVTVVAALLPAIRAARVSPMAALQDVSTPDRPLRKITAAGAVVGAIGAGLLGYGLAGAGDATLWTILAGVLLAFIGIALLTPVLARPMVAVLGRLFSWSVPGRLGRLNSGRNPRRTAITAAALMVGIALITGVNTLLTSAKRSIEGLAAEQVTADLLIAGQQTGPWLPTFDPAVLDRIDTVPGVAGTAAEFGDYALVNGERRYVAAVTDVPAVARFMSLRPVAGSMAALPAGQLALDDNTAGELGLAVGDTTQVQLSRGDPATYTVAGIFGATELYEGILLPESAAAQMRISQPSFGYIDVASGADVADVQRQVAALLVDSPEVTVNDHAGFIKQQSGSADQLLVMIQILLALAILIAVLGVVNTLALSVLERTREIGLLRAIGLGRGQTMRMITVEAVVITVFGAVLGLGVGVGLGAAVVRALRGEGIETLALPWGQMGVYLVLGGLVGVVAAVLPAIRAARVNVLAAIAHE